MLAGRALTSRRLLARAAMPDAGCLPLHVVLTAEHASVRRVLRDLHLLDLLPEGSTIPDAVLTDDPHLLGAFAHIGRGRGREQQRELFWSLLRREEWLPLSAGSQPKTGLLYLWVLQNSGHCNS